MLPSFNQMEQKRLSLYKKNRTKKENNNYIYQTNLTDCNL